MKDLKKLYSGGEFSELDRQFARLMARCTDQEPEIVKLVAALVSRSTSQGNVCLDLNQAISVEGEADGCEDRLSYQIDASRWAAALSRSPVVGQPGDFRPMILDEGRLYLHRHWQYEQAVAHGIRQRCRNIISANDSQHLKEELVRLFPEGDIHQQQAVLSALTQGFTVISGGPGTGKTYTIAKLILLMRQLSKADVRLKLAAPTGKAAMRLQQAIETALAAMGHEQAAKQLAGVNIQTLHRLLGARVGRSGFRYNAGRQLPVDVVMVDEASMIDLALMAALMAAMPAEARLVLVGDKSQLASVEAGAVLGDICSGSDGQKGIASLSHLSAGQDGSLSERIVVLKQGYRFATQGGIDDLASAVNAGKGDKALALLNRRASEDVVFKRIEDPHTLQLAIDQLATEAIVPKFGAGDPLETLARMERLIILSPLRNGPYGMVALNGYVERVLIEHGYIRREGPDFDGWYAGRPVMVTRNDYYHNLFNGDLGVAINNDRGAHTALSVYFPDGAGGFKQVPTQQLPSHQTAFAMTVHKSQGSEFDRVVLVLPQRETPLLTRELVYTAITRARRSVEIWGTQHCLNQAIEQRIKRSSGLGSLLWPTTR